MVYQKVSSNLQEKTLSLKQKKENQSNLQEGILYLGPKKQCIRRNQSNLQENTLSLKQKKENQNNLQDKDPVFKGNEIVYQKKSKQKARENPYVLECERIKKQQISRKKEKSMMI